MKRRWVIPAILVTGLAGLGGMTAAASAQDGDWRGGPGQMRDERGGDYGPSGPRWRDDDRRGDDNRGSRWRDDHDDDRDSRWRDDDRRGYGSREGRRDNDCGPRGRGWGRGGHGFEHHGRGYGRHDGYGRGREDTDRGYHRRDSDRGYGRHGCYHGNYHGRYHGRHDGRGGPRRFGAFDPARLDSAKKEIGVTAAQEQVWTRYAATLKDVADARRTRRENIDRAAIMKMSPDEHRRFRDSMIEQRRKEQDSVNAAVDELVKSLDEKQVAIAKEVLPGYAFGPWMRGAGMGWGGGGNR
ncbi:Spy/CpxP family protein refolding chaperone [Pseudorhodoplanes sp.]|uniref:Spy/CpxP family protein refolding chaperone n=1 Tax=Pseudorhodoplanes sp. TaxID=1934341 RepID=UPI003D0D5C98